MNFFIFFTKQVHDREASFKHVWIVEVILKSAKLGRCCYFFLVAMKQHHRHAYLCHKSACMYIHTYSRPLAKIQDMLALLNDTIYLNDHVNATGDKLGLTMNSQLSSEWSTSEFMSVMNCASSHGDIYT